ncbi:4400_t:CDS:2 [Cetraspora pellucida]|uniref:4400_t:CDS:1 n=1 Tax=Cetraspora pellucida TaxID=1433469 RepID=A0ACA9JYE6_9GLOM|nr:4400_t:CDS:2 [Cetraspora pellucida]
MYYRYYEKTTNLHAYIGIIELDQLDGADLLRLMLASDELQLPILITHAQDHLIKTQAEWINQTLVPILHIVCHHGTFGKLRDYTLKTVYFEDLEFTLHRCIPLIRFAHVTSSDFFHKIRKPFRKLLPPLIEEQILQFYLDPESRVHNFGSTLDSFIFSFNDTHNPTMATLSRIHDSLDEEAIYFSHSYGPCFGQNDLHMVDQSWNCRKTSYNYEILVDRSNFIADDYEVFQVVENDGLKEKKTEVLEERLMFIHSFDGYIR